MIGTTIIDFLHLFASTIWIGGMLFFNLMFVPQLTVIDPPQRGKLMGMVSKRFGMIAWSSIIILLVTGFLMTPSHMLFDTGSTFGLLLLIKMILFLIMIAIGSFITFCKAPKMQKLAPKPGEKPSPDFFNIQKKIVLLARTNMILGILILLLVAMQ